MPAPNDDAQLRELATEAIDLLSRLADGYHPAWDAQRGGYLCAYCGVLIRAEPESHRHSLHTERCAWVRAQKFLETIPAKRE